MASIGEDSPNERGLELTPVADRNYAEISTDEAHASFLLIPDAIEHATTPTRDLEANLNIQATSEENEVNTEGNNNEKGSFRYTAIPTPNAELPQPLGGSEI